MQLTDADFHPHLLARMEQRGVTRSEVEAVLNQGKRIPDTRANIYGRTLVFAFDSEWEGVFYRQKEVTVLYKRVNERMILLTVKARYGDEFKGK